MENKIEPFTYHLNINIQVGDLKVTCSLTPFSNIESTIESIKNLIDNEVERIVKQEHHFFKSN